MCEAYKQYKGRSASAAAGLGVLQGFAGMMGAGGFWNPVDSNALSDIESGFSELKAKWQTVINSYDNKLTKAQQEFHSRQLNLITEMEAFNDEILNEKIATNSLYIAILFAALIIVIIYLIVI